MLPTRAADRRALTEPSGSFGGLRPPANVAIGPDGSIYLLDAAKLALKRFDPCTCAFEAVPCIGGEGGEGRQWRNAHGIGICGADLYVCDTGLADATAGDPCADVVALRTRLRAENHRVSVFALKGLPCGVIFGRRDPTIRIGNRLRSPAIPAGAFSSPISSTTWCIASIPAGAGRRRCPASAPRRTSRSTAATGSMWW